MIGEFQVRRMVAVLLLVGGRKELRLVEEWLEMTQRH